MTPEVSAALELGFRARDISESCIAAYWTRPHGDYHLRSALAAYEKMAEHVALIRADLALRTSKEAA